MSHLVGSSVVIVPFFWLQLILFALIGAGTSFGVIGGSLLVPWIYGSKSSPFMMIVSFGYGVGSLISPLIAAQLVGYLGDVNGIKWSFWIISMIGIVISVTLCFLRTPKSPAVQKKEQELETQVHSASNHSEEHKTLATTHNEVSHQDISSTNTTPTTSPSISPSPSLELHVKPEIISTRIGQSIRQWFSPGWWKPSAETLIAIYLGIFLFLYNAVLVSYTGLLSVYTIGKQIMDISQAAYLISGFFIAFTVTRFVCIPLSFLDNRIILLVTMAGSTIDLIVLWIFSSNVIVIWVCTVLLGILLGPQYPAVCVVPTQSLDMPLTGKMLGIMLVGSSAGECLVPLIITTLMPYAGADTLVWICLILSVFGTILGAIMFCIFRKTNIQNIKQKAEQFI
jgi:fucose permease